MRTGALQPHCASRRLPVCLPASELWKTPPLGPAVHPARPALQSGYAGVPANATAFPWRQAYWWLKYYKFWTDGQDSDKWVHTLDEVCGCELNKYFPGKVSWLWLCVKCFLGQASWWARRCMRLWGVVWWWQRPVALDGMAELLALHAKAGDVCTAYFRDGGSRASADRQLFPPALPRLPRSLGS